MILDTTFLIDFLRGDPSAIATMQEIKSSPLFTTEINVFELYFGAYLRGKNSVASTTALLSQLTVLDLDRRSTLRASAIAAELTRKGRSIDASDILIAGIALAHGVSKIVSRNAKHFEPIDELEVVGY